MKVRRARRWPIGGTPPMPKPVVSRTVSASALTTRWAPPAAASFRPAPPVAAVRRAAGGWVVFIYRGLRLKHNQKKEEVFPETTGGAPLPPRRPAGSVPDD